MRNIPFAKQSKVIEVADLSEDLRELDALKVGSRPGLAFEAEACFLCPSVSCHGWELVEVSRKDNLQPSKRSAASSHLPPNFIHQVQKVTVYHGDLQGFSVRAMSW